LQECWGSAQRWLTYISAALAHLDLSYNEIGDAGAESLAGVLTQCRELTHLDLIYYLF
jgi:hypothetical protein